MKKIINLIVAVIMIVMIPFGVTGQNTVVPTIKVGKKVSFKMGPSIAPQATIAKGDESFNVAAPLFGCLNVSSGNLFGTLFYGFKNNSTGFFLGSSLGKDSNYSAYGVGVKNLSSRGGYAGFGLMRSVGGRAFPFIELGSGFGKSISLNPMFSIVVFIPYFFEIRGKPKPQPLH